MVLFSIFYQVLTAAGVMPLTSGTNASLALSQATDVITVCTTDYLVPALAAGVDVSGLANLPTQCNFTGITGKYDVVLPQVVWHLELS